MGPMRGGENDEYECMARRARSTFSRSRASYAPICECSGGERGCGGVPPARGIRRAAFCGVTSSSNNLHSIYTAAYAEDDGAEEGPGATTAAATTAVGSAVEAPADDWGVGCTPSNLALR